MTRANAVANSCLDTDHQFPKLLVQKNWDEENGVVLILDLGFDGHQMHTIQRQPRVGNEIFAGAVYGVFPGCRHDIPVIGTLGAVTIDWTEDGIRVSSGAQERLIKPGDGAVIDLTADWIWRHIAYFVGDNLSEQIDNFFRHPSDGRFATDWSWDTSSD